MQQSGNSQITSLKYVTAVLICSVVFFAFDIVDDLYERIVVGVSPGFLDLTHLFFEVFSAMALVLAIRILIQQLRRLQLQNSQQAQSLAFLRGEMDGFARRKFEEWGFSHAECNITMYMLKGLSMADIAQARSTAEGTVKAQTSNIYRKTGVSSRRELMSLFMDEFLDIGSRQPHSEHVTD